MRVCVNSTTDTTQRRMAEYACGLTYQDLPPEVVHIAKTRVIDTLGALIAGFCGDPCRIARSVAARRPTLAGATVIGTRLMTAPDLAAFVNATTARYVELTDSYHRPGGQGHPSDVVMPILAVAEYARKSGRDFVAGVVLGYEIFLRINDVFHNRRGFDHTIFGCLGSAVAAGRLLGLSVDRMSHCIAMAVVPNNTLRQARDDRATMFKAAATGHAARAGVYAALLARAGMQGPHLPFEGKAGWCAHVARERFSMSAFGGHGTPFKILETLIKNRPALGIAISSILAAEKLAPLRNIDDIKKVHVEVHQYAKEVGGTGDHRWHPDTREGADHSIPYVTAAALMDGTVNLRTYDDAHLRSPRLRALMQKISVTENAEFTRAFNQEPQQHRARITLVTESHGTLTADSGGDEDDMSAAMSDAHIEEKFRGLTEDVLGAKRVSGILEQLWHLEDVQDVAGIPRMFVI